MVFPIIQVDLFIIIAWRRLYGEKTVREAERAWFLSEGKESEALGINGAWPHLFPGAKATCF